MRRWIDTRAFGGTKNTHEIAIQVIAKDKKDKAHKARTNGRRARRQGRRNIDAAQISKTIAHYNAPIYG